MKRMRAELRVGRRWLVPKMARLRPLTVVSDRTDARASVRVSTVCGKVWLSAFLPSIAQNGYAAKTATVADGVRLPQSEGGWARDQRPVMVFSYDATNAEYSPSSYCVSPSASTAA